MKLDIIENDDCIFAVIHEQSQEELLQKELKDLMFWFDEYDNQVKQYTRCQRLGIEFDNDINELDNQAQLNAQRISEIRELLKQVNNI